jgi:hypothetical protein
MLPPDEKTALEAMKRVQGMSAHEIAKRMKDEVGDPMLAMFQLMAQTLTPDGAPNELTNRVVHLMVLAYTVRGEVGRQSPKPALRPVPKKRS